MPMLADPLGAHIPWTECPRFLAAVLRLGLAPEFALKADDLDSLCPETAAEIGRQCREAGFRPTVHAPFFDLNPGALDPLVRQVTLQRLVKTLDVSAGLDARLIVVHPGFDPWRYPNMEDLWLARACDFFRELLEKDQHGRCLIAVENIYEPAPETLVQLVNQVNSPRLGHCFDVGHWNLFGRKPLEVWLRAISSRLFHLHLHDNSGASDAHLPLGEGNIDFSSLLALLAGAVAPPSATLEAHSFAHLRRSHRELNTLLACLSA